MQFSTFQKNLDDWQGSSLIFGVLEEDIAGTNLATIDPVFSGTPDKFPALSIHRQYACLLYTSDAADD